MDKKKGKSSNEAKVEDGVPEAKYTRFGERIRQAIPGPMQCSVGCGGRNCKWENPARWSDEDQAIKGVFSSWVLENVVAMSRPSTEIIKKYKMMEQFKTHNICSIINLQRPGEHASCGPPLDKESLFTYRPQDFMDNDIFFYNFGWKDYGVTSLHTVLDMVKVMDFALEEGKVAVHCHAGLGRTGVLIACYLVYAHRMDPGAAILRVRKKRSNSIQTRGQISCIHDFWQFLRPLRVVFPQVVPKSTRLTLKQFLARQRHLLHGFEARELRHTPKLIHVICKRLSQIANGEVEEESEKTEEEVLLDIPIRRCRTVAEIRETLPRAFVNESLQEPQREFKTLPHSESDSKNKTTLLSPRVLRGESTLSSDASADGITEEIQADKKISVEDREARNSKKLKGENCNDQISTDETGEKANGQDSYNKLNSNFKGVEYVDGDILEKSPDTTSETLFVEKTIATETSEKETDNDMMDESEQIARDVNEILELNPRNINNNHSTIDNAQKMLKKKENLGVGEGEDNSEEKSRVLLSDNSPHPPHPDAGVKSLVLNQVASMKPSINPDTDSQTQHSAQVRKMRFSASQSETILPTGSPMKNPRGSAKGRKVVPDLHANSQKNEDEDHTPEMEDDDNLDEIIDIRNDDDPFLSDSDLENEDVGDRRTSSGQALSNSVASRVSWGRMKQASKANYSDDSTANTTNDDDYRGVSASSKASRTSGRRTPLMYRAEKNMELMEAGEGDVPDEEKLVEDEKLNNSDDSIYFDKSSEEFQMKEDELKGDEERCLLDGSLLGSELIVPMPYIPRINSTKSLNDLSSGLRVDLNSAISRSSSSGDVRHLSPAILAKQDPITVALAFANKLVDDEWLWEKVYTLQRHINSCNDAWDIVSADTDADLLAALMWSWIEHLSDPLLTPKDVGRMMTLLNRDNSDPLSKMPQQVVDVFETTLRSFDQEVNKTVMCLLSCITCFPPLPRKIAESMVHRTVVALIHTSLSSDSADIYRDLEQAFQYYVDAKFKVLNRKRFREDSIEKKQPVEIRTIYRAESSNSDIKSIGEIINKQSAALTIEPSPLPRSGGSVRSSASSGSSNTGNVTMISPRIVVN